MPAIDELLPRCDWQESHATSLRCPPERAFAAMLATPFGSDPVVRALLRLRGLSAAPTIEDAFRGMGFDELHRGRAELVVGACGTPWRPRGGLGPFGAWEPGTVRIATDVRAVPAPGGCVLSTETRIAAIDADARRAFGRYWRVVGPFSALIRRRWLAAARRAVERGGRAA